MHDGESALCQSFVEHEYNHFDAMDNAPVRARELAASFAARILVLSYSFVYELGEIGSEGGRQGDALVGHQRELGRSKLYGLRSETSREEGRREGGASQILHDGVIRLQAK
jgi:hypothetical protein